MPDLLLYGDTVRNPALRHEVPIAIMDPFLYAEVDGRPHVLTSPLLEAGSDRGAQGRRPCAGGAEAQPQPANEQHDRETNDESQACASTTRGSRVRKPAHVGNVSSAPRLAPTMELVRRRRFLPFAGSTLLVSACGEAGPSRPGDALVQLYADPAKDEWPDEFRQLPAATQELYEYAAANHIFGRD